MLEINKFCVLLFFCSLKTWPPSGGLGVWFLSNTSCALKGNGLAATHEPTHRKNSETDADGVGVSWPNASWYLFTGRFISVDQTLLASVPSVVFLIHFILTQCSVHNQVPHGLVLVTMSGSFRPIKMATDLPQIAAFYGPVGFLFFSVLSSLFHPSERSIPTNKPVK